MTSLRRIPFWFVWCLATRQAPAQDTTESGRLTIEINLPAFRLDARIDSVTVATFPVAVGMRRYPTPLGDFSITELEWNPWWRPPDSWWARNDSITPPGPRNPMGKVKMALGSRLYVHGTPQSRSIGTAASHACIRLRNADAVALARLVQQHGGESFATETMRAIMARWTTTHTVPLPSPIAVRIVYRLVELRGDEVQFHADIYRQGRTGVESEALALLSSAGHDSTAVDRELLRRVAEQAVRTTSTVKVAQLILPGEGSPDPE